MTEPDHNDLEQYLAGGSRVSRDYEALGQEQPPAALDSRILAEAAAGVGVKKARRRPAFWWLRPAALAATVLVSLSIVVRLGEFPRLKSSAPVKSAAPAVQVQVLPPRAVAEAEAPAAAPAPAPSPVIAEPHALAGNLANEPAMRPAPSSDAKAATDAMTSTVMALARKEARQDTPLAVSAMAAFTPAAMERAMTAIRSRVGEPVAHENAQSNVLARLPETVGGAAGKIVADHSAADARLREVLTRYDDGKLDAAAAALADFARDFPADPITLMLTSPPE